MLSALREQALRPIKIALPFASTMAAWVRGVNDRETDDSGRLARRAACCAVPACGGTHDADLITTLVKMRVARNDLRHEEVDGR
jgi:hypothetical protein